MHMNLFQVMLDGEDAMRIVKADLANLRLNAPPRLKSVSGDRGVYAGEEMGGGGCLCAFV